MAVNASSRRCLAADLRRARSLPGTAIGVDLFSVSKMTVRISSNGAGSVR